MTEEVKISYTQRICNLFTEDAYDKEEIIEIINKFSDSENTKRMNESSKMTFGKYRGKLVKDVAVFDKQYLNWLSTQEVLKKFPSLKANIMTLI